MTDHSTTGNSVSNEKYFQAISFFTFLDSLSDPASHCLRLLPGNSTIRVIIWRITRLPGNGRTHTSFCRCKVCYQRAVAVPRQGVGSLLLLLGVIDTLRLQQPTAHCSGTPTMASTTTTLEALQARVDALERARFQLPSMISHVDKSMRRARLAVERHGLYSATWKFVPEPYYTWPLDERAQCLGANSIHYLCKSLLLENRKAVDNNSDPTNPKFVLVVIQYATTLDVKKLMNAIRALRPVKDRLDDSQFEFRIASEEDNDNLTGYQHNSVTPFGLLQPVRIVLSQALVPLKFFWMGGGHVHLKLGMTVTDFCRALDPIVADISEPRIGMATAEELDG